MDSEFSNGLARPPSVPAPTSNDSVPAHDACAELIARLGRRQSPFERYKQRSQIGEGAMGQIFKAQDEDLHRDLAMKVMKPVGDHRGGTPRSPSSSREVARFVEEAQITGQLDHPGIVPVHELGLDPQGRLYFTMKLVRGRTLREVFDLAWKREEGWSTTRVLGVLLKVCEAMSYAHEHRVIHRDLKPGNIMVGRFGEVFVMDWGLARLLDKPDVKDIRVREEVGGPTTTFVSERHDGTPATPDSPLMTMDGDVIGTPAYMSPEQASGHVDRVGIQTDVYAIGAILYHLLTRRMPYVEPGMRANNYAVWRWLQQGPPTAVEKLAPQSPAELVAICEKAMARDPRGRYASAVELADELRAYLENRVVRAYRTGAIIELKKWVARNRAAAAGIVFALAALLAAAGLLTASQRQRLEQALLSSDVQSTKALLSRLSALSAARSDAESEISDWLRDAQVLLEREPRHEQRLRELIEEADASGSVVERRPVTAPPECEFAREKVIKWSKELEDTRREVDAGKRSGEALARAQELLSAWPAEIAYWRKRAELLAPYREHAPRLDDPMLQSLNESWTTVVDELRTLRERAIPEARDLLEAARSLRVRSIEQHAGLWDAAVRSIGDVEQCPMYSGLRLRPQPGLVPLGRDRRSGLWEFWHVLSGDRPERETDGSFVIGPSTGIVLVLIPGGRVDVGADSKVPSAVHYDPQASETETPARVDLAPYFISKYEMTQGQWLFATSEMPSAKHAGQSYWDDPRITRTNPVESVSWLRCDEVMRRLGLVLPTEAQWEHAARAGTKTPFPCGMDERCLEGLVNYADRSLEATSYKLRVPAHSNDGFTSHARVGRFPANAFGLHEVLGNVAEWCRDAYSDSCDPAQFAPLDGERNPLASRARVHRGGWFMSPLAELRLSKRAYYAPTQTAETLGVRPARRLEP